MVTLSLSLLKMNLYLFFTQGSAGSLKTVIDCSWSRLVLTPQQHGILFCPHSDSSYASFVFIFLLRLLICCVLIDLYVSARRNELSQFAMPAMSPTMTEGGIASWKKKEGEAFAVGDVLLEIVRIFISFSSCILDFPLFTRKPTRPTSTSKRKTTAS